MHQVLFNSSLLEMVRGNVVRENSSLTRRVSHFDASSAVQFEPIRDGHRQCSSGEFLADASG